MLNFECSEKVEIPVDKTFVYLKGEGMDRTSIVWDGHSNILTSATFASFADNILVSGITFVVRISISFSHSKY